MPIKINKLTKELLDDWMFFFDNETFTDNKERCECYCMCHHWNAKLNSQITWNCTKDYAEFNRKQAVEFIKQGNMQGYIWNMSGSKLSDSVIQMTKRHTIT